MQVITSFTVLSLCTILIALIPACYDTVVRQEIRFRSLKHHSKDNTDDGSCFSLDVAAPELANRLPKGCVEGADRPDTREAATQRPRRSVALAETLLGYLCDL